MREAKTRKRQPNAARHSTARHGTAIATRRTTQNARNMHIKQQEACAREAGEQHTGAKRVGWWWCKMSLSSPHLPPFRGHGVAEVVRFVVAAPVRCCCDESEPRGSAFGVVRREERKRPPTEGVEVGGWRLARRRRAARDATDSRFRQCVYASRRKPIPGPLFANHQPPPSRAKH